jgi:hypothetical protein
MKYNIMRSVYHINEIEMCGLDRVYIGRAGRKAELALGEKHTEKSPSTSSNSFLPNGVPLLAYFASIAAIQFGPCPFA